MPTMTLDEKVLELDADGFLKDPNQSTDAVAEAIARNNGIPVLTENHWKVIRFEAAGMVCERAHPPCRPTFGRPWCLAEDYGNQTLGLFLTPDF